MVDVTRDSQERLGVRAMLGIAWKQKSGIMMQCSNSRGHGVIEVKGSRVPVSANDAARTASHFLSPRGKMSDQEPSPRCNVMVHSKLRVSSLVEHSP